MDIPPNVAIRASIRPGSVYYFQHEKFTSSEPHYFVVININPLDETVILLVCASSKIETVKLRNKSNPAKTLVEVRLDQYPDFTCDSIFDCNYVYPQSIETLVERISSKKLGLKAEMNMAIVERLRQGVLASRLISSKMKDQLRMTILPQQ